jgi:hypothetical protein
LIQLAKNFPSPRNACSKRASTVSTVAPAISPRERGEAWKLDRGVRGALSYARAEYERNPPAPELRQRATNEEQEPQARRCAVGVRSGEAGCESLNSAVNR